MTYLAIDGQRATTATLRVPWVGAWYVDLDLDETADVGAAATVQIGTVQLVGTVDPEHTGTFQLAGKVRVIGGAGWSARVAPRTYHNDAGVKRSTVVAELAQEVGERIEILADLGRLPADFVRQSSPASRVLAQVLGDVPWWVGYDGVTRIGPRPAAEVPSGVEVLEYDPGTGVASLGLGDAAAVAVGATLRDRLDEPQVVRQLEVTASAGALRATAWLGAGAAVPDRLLRALRAIVREALPGYAFLGRYRYRVVQQVGARVQLQAVRKAAGLPDLLLVSIHPGMAGLSAKLTPGALVLVEFIEGDPSLPIVTHFAPEGEAGFLPVELAIDAIETVRVGASALEVRLGAGVAPVVRVGDMVQISPGNGSGPVAGTLTVTGGVSKVRA